jgi:hypothetical protein
LFQTGETLAKVPAGIEHAAGIDAGAAKRYRSPATSPFAMEIRRGEKNVFTFDLAP